MQASLDYKQRLQALFFPEGIEYDGIRFNRTAVTAPLFNYLAPDQSAEEILVSREGIEPSTRRLRVAPSERNRTNFERFCRSEWQNGAVRGGALQPGRNRAAAVSAAASGQLTRGVASRI